MTESRSANWPLVFWAYHLATLSFFFFFPLLPLERVETEQLRNLRDRDDVAVARQNAVAQYLDARCPASRALPRWASIRELDPSPARGPTPLYASALVRAPRTTLSGPSVPAKKDRLTLYTVDREPSFFVTPPMGWASTVTA